MYVMKGDNKVPYNNSVKSFPTINLFDRCLISIGKVYISQERTLRHFIAHAGDVLSKPKFSELFRSLGQIKLSFPKVDI